MHTGVVYHARPGWTTSRRGRVKRNDRGQRYMEKVRPWCGQPWDRERLKNRTERRFSFKAAYPRTARDWRSLSSSSSDVTSASLTASQSRRSAHPVNALMSFHLRRTERHSTTEYFHITVCILLFISHLNPALTSLSSSS